MVQRGCNTQYRTPKMITPNIWKVSQVCHLKPGWRLDDGHMVQRAVGTDVSQMGPSAKRGGCHGLTSTRGKLGPWTWVLSVHCTCNIPGRYNWINGGVTRHTWANLDVHGCNWKVHFTVLGKPFAGWTWIYRNQIWVAPAISALHYGLSS